MNGCGELVDTKTALSPEDPFALPVLPGDGGAGRARPGRRRRRSPSGRTWRSAVLQLRVLPSDKARLTAAAKRAGYTDLSSWSRGVLLATCDGEGMPVLDEGAHEELVRLRRDLGSGVGSNLNQVLAHANAMAKGGMPVDGDALLAAVGAAQAALDALRADLQGLLRPGGRR